MSAQRQGVALVALLTLAACSQPSGESKRAASASASATAAPSGRASATVAPPPVQAGAMAPRLRATEDGLLMSWIEPMARPTTDAGKRTKSHRVRFARFADGKWSAASTISEGPKVVANWADAPSVTRAGDGTLVAHWAEKSSEKAYAYDVVLGSSSEGKRWRRIGTAHDDGTASEHGFVSLLAEGKGVRAFWLDGRETSAKDPEGGHGAMTLRTALVSGGEVSAGEVLDARVCDCCGTSAAATSAGPLIAYRDRLQEEIRDIAVVGRAADSWSEPRTLHADGWKVPGCPVNGPALSADGDRVAAAWYTYIDERSRVRLAFSRDAGRTFGAPIEIDAPRGRRAPIGRVDVVLDRGGAVVSWLASEREAALLLAARVATDGRIGEPTVIARTSAARESGFPQLERLGDTLVLAWTKTGKPSHVAMRTLAVSDLAAPAAKRRAEPAAKSGVLAAGAKAPDYRAKLLDGGEVALSSLRGKVVLLNLWATWCEPCRHELRVLTKLHERYADKGVVIVAVSVDGNRDVADIRKFTEQRKLPYTIWHDREDRASTAFGVSTLPANFVITRNGAVAWSKSGAITANDEALTEALDAALKSAPDEATPAP